MSDQRLYVVRSTFDGTTPATEAMAWVPGSSTGQQPANVRYRRLVVETVGLFSPQSLGRTRTTSLVRVWADTPAIGDAAQVLGSGAADEANPILAPRGASVALASGPATAMFFELNMTDYLAVSTTGERNVYIEVVDLDEPQHLAYILNNRSLDLRNVAYQSDLPLFSSVPGEHELLVFRGQNVPTTGTAPPKNTWRGGPMPVRQATPCSALKIVLTVLATGGTCVCRIGLWARNANGSPGALVTDLSALYGTFDLTVGGGAVGPRTINTPGLVFNPGQYCLAIGWDGTATSDPTLSGSTGLSGISVFIPSATASGWSMSAPAATTPLVFTPTANASCPLIFRLNP